MDLKIESEQLTKLIESGVMQALGEAGREAVVKQVIKHLTTEGERNNYTGRCAPSPLMAALQNASERIAVRVLTEKLEGDPEFVASVESLYVEAFKRFNGTEQREAIIKRMADRLAGAFDKDRY